jgi:hypothetical protein
VFLIILKTVMVQKQLDHLDRFTDDLAVAVDRSLERFVGTHLDQLPGSVRVVMQGVIENGVTSRLDRMPETLGNAVREPLNDAMKPVSDALASFGASISRTNEDAVARDDDVIPAGVEGQRRPGDEVRWHCGGGRRQGAQYDQRAPRRERQELRQ